MKYMGSKAAMLEGQLGALLLEEARTSSRFVDLFAGSATVSHYIAEKVRVPVLSVDLQAYSRVAALAITGRTAPLVGTRRLADWLSAARNDVAGVGCYSGPTLSKQHVLQARRSSDAVAARDFITNHYGGHYVALEQSRALDALYRHLPARDPHRTLCLSAIISTTSSVVAAPGHTAQPFQPTETLLPFIDTAWRRDVFETCEAILRATGLRHALVRGSAITASAETALRRLTANDLVFCDPPYSAVQYSRFYHALEGLARGGWPEVNGAGRSPALEHRASSAFSMRTAAKKALASLLDGLHARGCRAVFTFPDTDASNGLSAATIQEGAEQHFAVETLYVTSRHSTLGGSDETTRGSRRDVKEAVMLLTPR